MEFKKVSCPNCQRTLSHYISGTDSVYRNTCPKCKNTVLIYSAGKTAIFNTSAILSIELQINF